MPLRNRYQHAQVEGARVGRYNLGINTTFVVYRIGDTLIDTGPANQWSSVRRFIDERKVSRLLLTHHHEDHSGNAARIAAHCRLTPFAPEPGRAKLAKGYRTPPMQKLVWGSPRSVQTQPLPESMTLPNGMELRAIPTPGHAKDLHCFFLPEDGWLFSGDLYISRSIRYLRSDENLSLMIDSIRKVLALDFEIIFCPHRGIKENAKQALAEKMTNMLELCARSQDLSKKGYGVREIADQLLGPNDIMGRLSGNSFSKANLISEALSVNEVH